MFSGSIVAMVTPFRKGRVDERALGDLIEFQLANGTDGIVPCGTTGESATLTHQEHERVVAIRNIVAIKEGSGSLQQVSEIIQACGDRFTVLSGDDPLTIPMMAVGAKGVITVTANIAPADMAAMVDAFAAGQLDRARRL